MNNQLLAPFRTNQANSVWYAGQSGYPSIQSAVTAAHAAGGGIVELQPDVTVTDTIAAVAGFSDTFIVDRRVAPSVQYSWTGSGPYAPVANTQPGGPDYAIQSRTPGANTFAGDAGFARDSSGNINVVGKTINLKKSDGTGAAALSADADGVTADLAGTLGASGAIVAKGATPSNAASRVTVDYSGGNARIVGWGPDGATPGTIVFVTATATGGLGVSASLAASTGFSATTQFNTTIGYRVNNAAPSGQYIRGNGTNGVFSAIQAADVPTLNQNTTGTAANVTGIVAIANGGTNSGTAAGARTNLGLGTMAVQNSNAVAVTGGAIDGTAIGSTIPSSGVFTSVTATTTLSLANLPDATNSGGFVWGAYSLSPFPVAYEDRKWVTTAGQATGVFQDRFLLGFAGGYLYGLSRQGVPQAASNLPDHTVYTLPAVSYLSGDIRAANLSLGVSQTIITSSTSLQTLLPSPGTIFRIDATSGNIIVSLPNALADTAGNPAPMQEGATLIFKRLDNSSNTVTITVPAASQGIDYMAQTTVTIAARGVLRLALSYPTPGVYTSCIWLII